MAARISSSPSLANAPGPPWMTEMYRKVSGVPVPGGSMTATAPTALFDGSTIVGRSWTQIGGPDIGPLVGDSPTFNLPDASGFKEALIEIPISIKAVPSDTLERISAQSLADVARLVPGEMAAGGGWEPEHGGLSLLWAMVIGAFVGMVGRGYRHVNRRSHVCREADHHVEGGTK